jgi:hypothetical protein
MANIHWYNVDEYNTIEKNYSTFALPTITNPSLPNLFTINFGNNVTFRPTYYDSYNNIPTGDWASEYGDAAYAFSRSTVVSIDKIPNGTQNLYKGFDSSLINNIKNENIPNSVINLDYAFANTRYFNQKIVLGNHLSSLNGTFFNSKYNNSIINQIPISDLNNAFYKSNYNQSVSFVKDANNIELQNAFAYDNVFNYSVIGKTLSSANDAFANCTTFNNEVDFELFTGSLQKTFFNCQNFNQELTFLQNYSINNVRSLESTFVFCYSYNQNTFIPPAKTLNSMLAYCHNFNSNITFASEFYGNESIKTSMVTFLVDGTNFNQKMKLPDNVTNLYQTFANCTNLNSLISINELSPVLDMSGCFTNCANFNQPINLPNTIVNLHGAFSGCVNFSVLEKGLMGSEKGLRDISQAFISTNITDSNMIQISKFMPLENVYQAFAKTNVFSPSYFHSKYLYQNENNNPSIYGLYETFKDGKLDNIYKVDESITSLNRTFYGAQYYPANGYISIPGSIKILNGTFAAMKSGDYYYENSIKIFNEVSDITIQLEEGVEELIDTFTEATGAKVSVPNSVTQVSEGTFTGVKSVCYEGSLNTFKWDLRELQDNFTSIIDKHDWDTKELYQESYCYQLGGYYVKCKRCGGHKWVNRNEEYGEHKFVNGYCFYCGRPEHLEDYFIYIIGLLDENNQIIYNKDKTIYEASTNDLEENKRAFVFDINYDKWDEDFGSMSVIELPDKLDGYTAIII